METPESGYWTLGHTQEAAVVGVKGRVGLEKKKVTISGFALFASLLQLMVLLQFLFLCPDGGSEESLVLLD